MKRTSLFSLLAALALGVGACQKQQTEAERNAEIERRVQQRVHTERQADDRKKMAQLQAKRVALLNALAAARNVQPRSPLRRPLSRLQLRRPPSLNPREIVPIERDVAIINQTTNVTNITYNNSVIVDHGPSYDDLRSRSRQPIERFRLERKQDFNTGAPVFRDYVVARPTMNFRPAKRAVRPNRLVRTIAQPVAKRGWTGISDPMSAALVSGALTRPLGCA